MSVVHAALDHTTGRRLALKVLREPRPERLSVLKEEFRVVAGVVHPNLVHMHELFDGPDGTFFTMELIEGVGLWSWIRKPQYAELGIPAERQPHGYCNPPRPLQGEAGWARLLSVAGQLATALSVLHSRGILHRDVKPLNALVRPDGTVVVLDFGLSRSLRESRPDPYGRVGGTIAYMAPEQTEVRPASASADWYAMGATLFELASGCLPYPGDDQATYEAKLARDRPRRLEEVVSTAPVRLAGLVNALLDPDPDSRPSRAAIFAALGLGTAVGQETMPEISTVQAKPIGRESALAFLHGGLVEALSLGRSLRVLRGESGIGKSTLALWFARRARSEGAVVFRGRCYERESIPFKAFDRLIDRLVDRIARRGPAGRMAVVPRNRRALVRLFPSFGRLPEFEIEGTHSEADSRLAEATDSAAVRGDAFAALASLLTRYAGGRLILIVLDDVQWADRDSAALAAYLLSSSTKPLMVLLCRRPEGTTPDVQTLAGDVPLPRARVHDLARLDEDDARAVARRALGEEQAAEALVEAVVRESDGSPFWLEQLGIFSRMPTRMGPDGAGVVKAPREGPLDGLLQAAIRECSLPARDLLLALAVAGRPVDRPLAQAVAGDAALRSADRLEEAGLVVVRRIDDGAGLEVRHERVADAALALASDVERRSVHDRLASALIEADGDAEEISVHLFASGDTQRGAVYALDGSRDAGEVLAFGRAARLLQIAIDHEADAATRVDLIVELGDVLANDSRGGEAAEAYLSAADGVDGPRALVLRQRAADQLMRSGRIDRGRDLLEHLLDGSGLHLDRSPVRSILHLLWGRARLSMRGIDFKPRAEHEIAAEVLSRIDSAWGAAVTLGLVDAVAAAALQVNGLLLALKVGEPKRVARALGAEAVFHSVFGDHVRADELLARHRSLVEDLEAAEIEGVALAQAIVAYQRGDWTACRDWSRKTLKHLAGLRTNLSWTRSTAVVYRLAAAGQLGQLQELTRVLPRELAHARARGDLHAVLHLSLGMPLPLDAILDHPAAGIERARSVWADSPGQRYDQLQIHALRTEAELALVAADVETAQSAGRRCWRLANVPAPLRIVVVYLSTCELALRCELCGAVREGLDRARLRSIRAHLRRLEASGAPWVLACAALARAQLSDLQADRGSALSGFDRAMGLFAEQKMHLHQEVSRYGRGRLLGGDVGRDERAKAVAWAHRGGAVAPLRLFRMIAPGIDGERRG